MSDEKNSAASSAGDNGEKPAPDGYFNNAKGIDEIGDILAMRQPPRASASRQLSILLYLIIIASTLLIIGAIYFVARQASLPSRDDNPLYATDSYLTIANELKRLAATGKELDGSVRERVIELTGHADYGLQRMARVALARTSGLFDYPDVSRIDLTGGDFIDIRWPDGRQPDYLLFGTAGSQQINDLMKGLTVAEIRAKTYQPINAPSGQPAAPKPFVRSVPSLSPSE